MVAFRFDDPDQYVKGSPHEVFGRLRKEAPFTWHQPPQSSSDGFWLATKHSDVIAISKQPKIFATWAPLLSDPLPAPLWPQFPALAMIADNLLTFDDSKHARFRALINPLFSGTRVSEFKSQIRSKCIDLITPVSLRPRFDFAADLALQIPVEIVLGMLLGVPHEDLEMLTRCVLTINAMDDPVFRPNKDALLRAAEELFDYGMTRLRHLKTCPGSDVLSEIIHDKDASGLSAEELFLGYWFPLVAGAFDTTAATIAGGVQALLQFPEQLERLRKDAEIIPLAAEEMIRWVSPVIYFRRTALSDTDYKGNTIKKGQKIILCYASANRDEEVFANPDSFDVERTPNNHVAFGYGSHFCLGARLAASMVRIFLEEFLVRMPVLEIDGEVIRTRSGWMNRIRSMPVRTLRNQSAGRHC